MVVDVDVRDGEPVAVLLRRVEGDAVARLWHILAAKPAACGMGIAFDIPGHGAAPAGRLGEGGEVGKAERLGHHVDAAGKAP